jgi:hypothetical protein
MVARHFSWKFIIRGMESLSLELSPLLEYNRLCCKYTLPMVGMWARLVLDLKWTRVGGHIFTTNCRSQWNVTSWIPFNWGLKIRMQIRCTSDFNRFHFFSLHGLYTIIIPINIHLNANCIVVHWSTQYQL